MSTVHAVASDVRSTTNWPLAFVLAVGPVLSVFVILHMVSEGTLGTTLEPFQYLTVALVFWSPLPFSISAMLLESHRDAALPSARGVVERTIRGFLLIPYLLFSPRSTARVETAASLVGFALALMLALPSLVGA